MKVVAPAKLNLYLWVGARRPDGLHEIESVMQSVSLVDELVVDAAGAVTLDVSPPGAAPEDESNLVVAAVRALQTRCSSSGGAALSLTKRIPAGAGLGGGSSDAAAALVGLNRLWGCALSMKAVEKVGAGIGADVPFCVRGGTAGALGVGERLAPLVVRDSLWWVIVVPPTPLSTADVYRRFDELGGSRVASDAHELADALARGSLERIGAALRNDLFDAAVALAPAVEGARSSLLEAGAIGASMSGSGSACFGLAHDEDDARGIASRVASDAGEIFVARSMERGAKIIDQ